MLTRCPYCRKMLQEDKWGDPTARWGSPYRTCPHCGKECVDTGRIEPALKELQIPDLSIRHLAAVHFFPYGLIAVLCLLGSLRSEQKWVWILLTVFMIAVYLYRVISAHKSQDAVIEKMNRLYAESQERLRDPVYIRALAALDYPVSQELLDYAAQFPEEEDDKEPETLFFTRS